MIFLSDPHQWDYYHIRARWLLPCFSPFCHLFFSSIFLPSIPLGRSNGEEACVSMKTMLCHVLRNSCVKVFFFSLSSHSNENQERNKKIKKVSAVNIGFKHFFTSSEIKIAVHHSHIFDDSFLFTPVLARPPMGQWGNGQKNGQRPNYFWGLWFLFSLAVSHITKQNDRELQFRT